LVRVANIRHAPLFIAELATLSQLRALPGLPAKPVQSRTQPLASAAAAALLSLRREALTALGYGELVPRDKAYVGLHTPDADPVSRIPASAPEPRNMSLFQSIVRLFRYLEAKNDILLVTTSNRYEAHTWDAPKSSALARLVQEHLEESAKRVTSLDVTKLKIHTCEGNISGGHGNNCGVPAAKLEDAAQNPTGHHRCWASFNNPDDELYQVSRALFRSKVVIFFASVRWGQTNSVYQRLFERLSWIENRVSTLGESPIPELRELEAGMVLFGHNWNAERVLETQKQNFEWFGWTTPEALSFAWQHTDDAEQESPDSYLAAIEEFRESLRLGRLR
jgi:hypothetical protein